MPVCTRGRAAIAAGLLLLGLSVAAASGPAGASATPVVQADAATYERISGEAEDALVHGSSLAGFAGVRISPTGVQVVVYSTTVTPSLTAQVVGPRSSSDYQFVQVTHTAAQLDSEMNAIVDDYDALKALGVVLTAVYPSPEQDGVLLEVSSGANVAKPILTGRYGTDVTVEQRQPLAPLASRLNESAPWSGGDVIAMDNGGDCSAGPAIVRGGTTYLLTAGHCFLSQEQDTFTTYIYRVFQRSHLEGGVNKAAIGYAAAQYGGGYDLGIIDARAYGYDWRTQNMTDVGSPAAGKQVAAESSVGGMRVCASGAFEGESCDATVIHAGGTVINPDGISMSHETEVVNDDSTIIAGEGDSGGPVYEVHSNGLFVTGVINWGAVDLYCVKVPERGLECSDDVHYQEVPSILNHLGATLYTP